MSEPEWRQTNRANWDERVPIHLNAPDVYNQDALRAGTKRLDELCLDVLGPVPGARILHLQCHFGMDTLVLAQGGARLVGVDFSAPAIAAAERLADDLGLSDRARFVVSDVYEAAAALPEPASFDRVFISWGALCWLPDLAAWARVVAHFLKPGGWLALVDAHPMAYVFDSRMATPDGMPGWFMPYLGRVPMIEDRTEDYADSAARLSNTRTHEWLHPVADLITGLIDAGLRIDVFREHNHVAWPLFDTLVPAVGGGFRWPDRPWLPLSFSMRASKAV